MPISTTVLSMEQRTTDEYLAAGAEEMEQPRESGVDAWFTAWAARDFEAMAAMYHPDAELVRPDGSCRGSRQIVDYLKALAAADPGVTATVDAVLPSPGAVVVEWTESYTGAGAPERVLVVFRVAGGRIVSQHEYFDPARRLRLLAALSLRAPAEPAPVPSPGLTVIAAPVMPVPVPSGPESAAAPEIWAQEGPDRGLRYRIAQAEVGVGRALDNNLVLRDPLTSGHHARFEATDGQVSVIDLTSTNGTYVNGERVQRRVLAQGDQITIGQNVLVVAYPGSPGSSY
jgi:uncharacterized protein (TIGR02246 family)